MLLKQFTKLFADFSEFCGSLLLQLSSANQTVQNNRNRRFTNDIKRYSRLPFTLNEWEYLDYQTDDRSLKSILQIFDR